jgi:hypothetical protein
MEAHLTLQAWWAKTGAEIPIEPISELRIAEFESRYGVILPSDFRAYLSHSCPKDENWDDEMGNWWPLARIKSLPDEYPHAVAPFIAINASKYLFFLDHCIWCWAWAISCADDETYGSVVLIGGSDRVVASTFTAFVDRYTTDWLSVA